MKRSIVAFLACIAAASANGAILVEKPPMPGTDFGGLNSNVGLDYEREADDFSIIAPAQVNTLTWYGWVDSSSLVTADFDILFYNDVGLPSNPAFYTTTLNAITGSATGISTAGGTDIYKWTATIPSVDLTSPGRYWISIQAHTDSIDGNRWIWAFADPIDGEAGAAFQDNGTNDWQGFSVTDASYLTDAFAFTLSNVPIPAAIWLFYSGLLGLMSMAGRRRIHS